MLMLKYAMAYGTSICEARPLNENDHPERYRDNGKDFVFSTGNNHDLKYADYFKILDLLGYNFQGRKVWYFFGCSNFAYEISQEEWDEILALENKLANEAAEKERQEREAWERKYPSPEKVDEMKSAYMAKHGITGYNVEPLTVRDEGGETLEYRYNISVNGKSLNFVERNIFDFGVVINPDYKVLPDEEKGGLVLTENGEQYFKTYVENEGWVAMRPLTVEESAAYGFVSLYGKYGKYGYAVTRM